MQTRARIEATVIFDAHMGIGNMQEFDCHMYLYLCGENWGRRMLNKREFNEEREKCKVQKA